MSRTSMLRPLAAVLLAVAAPALAGLGAQGPARSAASAGAPAPASDAAARGVRCPEEFESVFDAATKVLRCRRDVVSS